LPGAPEGFPLMFLSLINGSYQQISTYGKSQKHS
jgi:hypothetical protein